MDEELVAAIADRAGWSETGSAARYEPTPGRWSALVRRATNGSSVGASRRLRFHISILSPAGAASRTYWAGTARHAVAIAESQVAAE